MSTAVLCMSMSLDGFVAGPNEGPGNGLGDGGHRLHEWGLPDADADTKTVSGRWNGVNGKVLDELMATGTVVAGRGTFELADGWGGDHHDGVPIFILARRGFMADLRTTSNPRRNDEDQRSGSMDQPTAEQALRRLQPLVGEWAVEAKWPNGQSWPGRVAFEWHDSGAHLLQRGTLEHPEAPDNLSIIGCDAANGTYFQLYSDERDVCRVYEMSIDDREWKLWRDGEPFSQRFKATFSDDGNTITGRWEIAEDGTSYTIDFDLILRRVGT